MNKSIEQILIEIQEYFDDKADADWDYDQLKFIPNTEMKLSLRVELLKELLSDESKAN